MNIESLVRMCKEHRQSNGHPTVLETDITEFWCESSCVVADTCPLLADKPQPKLNKMKWMLETL